MSSSACRRRRTKAARAASARELVHHIKSVIGVSSRGSTCTTRTASPRSEGKAKRVVDNRPKQWL